NRTLGSVDGQCHLEQAGSKSSEAPPRFAKQAALYPAPPSRCRRAVGWMPGSLRTVGAISLALTGETALSRRQVHLVRPGSVLPRRQLRTMDGPTPAFIRSVEATARTEYGLTIVFFRRTGFTESDGV